MRLGNRPLWVKLAVTALVLILVGVVGYLAWPTPSEDSIKKASPVRFSNLYPEASKASLPISELAIGQTQFTTFGEPESAPNQMVSLSRHPEVDGEGVNGKLCVTSDARMWDQPAAQVGDYATANIAIKRTGEHTYTVIASEEMAEVITRDSGPYLPCLKGSRAIIDVSPESREVLNLVEDMKPGSQGWVPGNLVWIADANATRGYLLANTTRRTSFPDATHVYKQADGTLLVDGSQKEFEHVGVSQIESLDTATRPFQAVVIA